MPDKTRQVANNELRRRLGDALSLQNLFMGDVPDVEYPPAAASRDAAARVSRYMP